MLADPALLHEQTLGLFYQLAGFKITLRPREFLQQSVRQSESFNGNINDRRNPISGKSFNDVPARSGPYGAACEIVDLRFDENCHRHGPNAGQFLNRLDHRTIGQLPTDNQDINRLCVGRCPHSRRRQFADTTEVGFARQARIEYFHARGIVVHKQNFQSRTRLRLLMRIHRGSEHCSWRDRPSWYRILT